MSFQEMTAEIPRLTIHQQLHLLEMLTASLRVQLAPNMNKSDPTIRYDDTPLDDFVGSLNSGKQDLSAKHDDYLYGTHINTSEQP